MKKSFLSLLAVGALALASCSDDVPANGPEKGEAEGQGIGYMAFTIATDATSSRADDVTVGEGTSRDEVFNIGDADEYALAPHNRAHLAIFFDDNGTFFGANYLSAFSQDDSDNHGSMHQGNKYVDSEKFYTFITRWRNSEAKALPSQVVVLVNYNPGKLEALTSTLEVSGAGAGLSTLLETINEKDANDPAGFYVLNGTPYFSMSNSTYVENNTLVQATKFDESCICATPEDALRNRVVVYVERMVAKYTVTFDSKELSANTNVFMTPKSSNGKEATVYVVSAYGEGDDDLDYPTTVETKWQAYVANWNMNALEPTTYAFKHVDAAAANKVDYYFGEKATWYSVNNLHRSYWAESPLYSTGIYPTQYRNFELEANRFDPEEDYNYFSSAIQDGEYSNPSLKDYNASLIYIPFTNVIGGAKAVKRYTVERTYGMQTDADGEKEADQPFKGYFPYKYATQVLVGCQFVLEGETANAVGADNLLTNVSDKYCAYNYVFTNEKSYIRMSAHRLASYFCDGLAHTLKSGATVTPLDNWTLYLDAQGTKALDVRKAEEVFETVAAYAYHSDGKVVIAPKEGVTLYYKNKANEAVVALEAADLQALVYELTEPAKHYNKGYMYYAVPVQHMFGLSGSISSATGSNVNLVKITKYAGYNAETPAYALGQFGAVRNHWYKMNFITTGENSSITTPGIPVDDPDQPIIPDPEDEYSVALEIVVLPWHVIDMGDIDL